MTTTKERLEAANAELKLMQSDRGYTLYETELQRDLIAALTRLQEVENAVTEFCNKSDWSAEVWKRQPHIAALFTIRDAATKPKQEDGPMTTGKVITTVEKFSKAMRDRLQQKEEQGYEGWDDPDWHSWDISRRLQEKVTEVLLAAETCDPVDLIDIANFAMFLHTKRANP